MQIGRLQVLEKVNHLLDNHCKGCMLEGRKDNKACHNGCVVGRDLLKLGDLLLTHRKPKPRKKKGDVQVAALEMTIPEYLSMKNEGLKDKDIAAYKGVKKQTLANWKYTRKEALLEAEGEGEKKIAKQEPPVRFELNMDNLVASHVDPSENWKAKYEQLEREHLNLWKTLEDRACEHEKQLAGARETVVEQNDLIEQMKEEHRVVRESLDLANAKQLDEANMLDRITAEYNDVMESRDRVVKERDELENELWTQRQDNNRLRDQLSDIMVDYDIADDELKALRKLVRIYMEGLS